ncbi:MAG: diguanylate cyclase [Nitrosomonadales bacterium]|nr:diguanylate cyclase [Nitrosomonadales bacterium]
MAKNHNDLKVLVVEDSKVTMKALSNYLERMGIRQPLTAGTGQAALDIFRRNRPDIVLLDAILPDIDGFDIAKQMRAAEKGDEWSAIIFLTSMAKDEDLAHGIAVGGDDYLMKPISEVVLKAKMRAMHRLVDMQRSLVSVTQKLNTANRELQRLATTDGLTGIANRRMFDELARREWRRCMRIKQPMSLVMVDVDHFKAYNDTYGHQAGDDCLKAVAAQVARAAPRASDLAARYGGEEFVLVLGDTTLDGACWVANNIRQHVDDLGIPHTASQSRHVTISCGVASMTPYDGLPLEALLNAADSAMYRAKAQGRNAVVCAGE